MRRPAVFLLLLAFPAALAAQSTSNAPNAEARSQSGAEGPVGPVDDAKTTAKKAPAKPATVGPPNTESAQPKPRVFGGTRIKNGRRTNGVGVQLPF